MAAATRPAKVNSVEGVSSSYYVGKMGRNKDSLILGKHAIVCQDTELRGEVFVGAGTVLNPQCKILAESGPIRIGVNNIIEEKVIIVNKSTTPLTIGDDNVFEVGCYIEGAKIGNKNVIEAKASVLGTTTVGDNCVIGAVCSTRTDEVISDNTVIYGNMHNRRVQTANTNQVNLHTRHLEYLRDTLPKFNHIRGGNESKSTSKSTREKESTRSEKESRDKPRREPRDRSHDKEHRDKPQSRERSRDSEARETREAREARDREYRERTRDNEARETRETREARDRDSHERDSREKRDTRDREQAKKVGVARET